MNQIMHKLNVYILAIYLVHKYFTYVGINCALLLHVFSGSVVLREVPLRLTLWLKF